jgi:hypothetical protein
MWHMNGHGKGKAGITLQIAIAVMLLCMPHLPLLVGTDGVQVQPKRCAMDHRLCGCAPERIASRTCCCFRNMKFAEKSVEPGHCLLQAKAHEEPGPDADASAASCRLSSLPCGQDPQMISHATSEMKYLCSARAPLPMDRSAPYNTPPCGDGYLGPSLEPPVPPPEISILV